MLELTAHRLDLHLNMSFETLTAPCCKFRWSFRSDGMNIVDANIRGVIFLHLIDGSLGKYLILFLGSPLVMWHLKRWGEYISSGSRVQTRGTLWVAFDLIRYVPDEDLVLRPLLLSSWNHTAGVHSKKLELEQSKYDIPGVHSEKLKNALTVELRLSTMWE